MVMCEAKLYNPLPCERKPAEGERVCAICRERILTVCENYGIYYHLKGQKHG